MPVRAGACCRVREISSVRVKTNSVGAVTAVGDMSFVAKVDTIKRTLGLPPDMAALQAVGAWVFS